MKTSVIVIVIVIGLAALTLSCGGGTSSTPPPVTEPAVTESKAAPTAAAPPSTPDAPFRAKKPDPLTGSLSFQAPVAVPSKLKNGMTVLVRENHAVPLVVVEVVIQSGVNGEPESKGGLADFTAEMLTEGTKSRGPLEIAAALEDLAATLRASASVDAIRVHLNCLTETLPAALDVLADVVQNPAFKSADVERHRGQKLTELEQKNGSPNALAFDQMNRLLYGPKHPAGRPQGGTPKSVAGITSRDLAAFHAAWFHPDNAFVSVSGDVTPDEAVTLLEQKLGAWKGKAKARLKTPPLPVLGGRALVVVERPDQSQSTLVMATPVFSASDPDAVPLELGNFAVGGLFSSRLNMNLRENKGYSYGVFSFLALRKDDGALIARGGIVAKNTVEATSEMKNELDRFGSGDVTDAELEQAKEAAVRRIPSELETNDAVAAAMSNLVVKGLPLDYYATLPAKVAAVMSADVKRVVSKVLGQAPWQTVIVGPVGPMESGLDGLGAGKLQKVQP